MPPKVSCHIGVTLQVGGVESRNFVRIDLNIDEVDVYNADGSLDLTQGLGDAKTALGKLFNTVNDELFRKIEDTGIKF